MGSLMHHRMPLVLVFISDQLSTIPSQRQLYCSKSRVTPQKATTIPRLELCGALLLAELASIVTR